MVYAPGALVCIVYMLYVNIRLYTFVVGRPFAL